MYKTDYDHKVNDIVLCIICGTVNLIVGIVCLMHYNQPLAGLATVLNIASAFISYSISIVSFFRLDHKSVIDGNLDG